MRCLFFFFSPCLCDGRRGKALSQAISEHPASAVVRNLRWVHRVSIASVSRQWSTGSDAFISMSSAAGSPQHQLPPPLSLGEAASGHPATSPGP